MKRVNSLYNVKTRALFNLKINREVRDEFRAATELRGATMSGVIHQFIFQFIREVKKEMPDEFAAKLDEVLARKSDLIAEESVAKEAALTHLPPGPQKVKSVISPQEKGGGKK